MLTKLHRAMRRVSGPLVIAVWQIAPVAPAQDESGRTRLAYATYKMEDGVWIRESEPDIISPQDLVKTITEPTLICGELSQEARSVIGRRWKNAMIAPPAYCLRRAGFLAEMGWERLMTGHTDDPVTLSPIYISTSSVPIPS